MNTNFIRQAINNFNCEKTFSDANINEVVSLFNKLLFNIFNNYIPHETITCDDKDFPWLTSWFKSLIESKNTCHKNYRMYQTIAHLMIKLNLLQEQLHLLINKSKQNYYRMMEIKMVNIPKKSHTYFPPLNHFLNNKNYF